MLMSIPAAGTAQGSVRTKYRFGTLLYLMALMVHAMQHWLLNVVYINARLPAQHLCDLQITPWTFGALAV